MCCYLSSSVSTALYCNLTHIVSLDAQCILTMKQTKNRTEFYEGHTLNYHLILVVD